MMQDTGRRPSAEEIKDAVKTFLVENLIRVDDPEVFREDTPLISAGVLDSLAAVRLVAFLEERYGVAFEAHEISVDHFDSVKDIAASVLEKLGA